MKDDNRDFNYNKLGYKEYKGLGFMITDKDQINDIYIDDNNKTIYIKYIYNNDDYWFKISNCCVKLKESNTFNINNDELDKYYVLITPNNQKIGVISVESVVNKLKDIYFEEYN